jgi:molybdopterin molybdotransferase
VEHQTIDTFFPLIKQIMVQTTEAEHIILTNIKNYGTELIPFESATGRVLAEDIIADRDLPPYNRSTMDGVAILCDAFAKGIRSFTVKATMAAGDIPIELDNEKQCIEIMTGAALPDATDTVIRYEDIEIENGVATIRIDVIKKGQNVHIRGKDKKQGSVVVKAPCYIDAATIGMAASVGASMLQVKTLPKVVVIATGDELVDVTDNPSPWQIRKSNVYTIQSVLQQHSIQPSMLHIIDDLSITKEKIGQCLLDYDVILLSGGISMGKFDYVPQALEELNVTKLFHKVAQRPGKPFWFGAHSDSGKLVFAFPGNPVSGFMCLYRYFLPWLRASLLGPAHTDYIPYAVLDADVTFTPQLQYFLQVSLSINTNGQLLATPVEGNGSGDFSNLLDSNAFMELPAERTNFNKGEVFRIWPFKPIM